MTDVLAFSVFGVEWQFIKPFIVIGLAFGGVYALSGVGLVVLYRATGVLNLAFGAIGAAGALIAYWLINHTSCPQWLAFAVCVAFGGVVNLLYGMVFGPAFARRDPLVKMMGTLGLALILLGIMAWMAPVGGAFARFLPLPSTQHRYEILDTSVNLTQIISLGLAIVITAAVSVFLRVTKLGTAMRALANDREITATLGVPVRRVEAAAWFGSGLACGAAGLILPDLLTSLDYSALTFLVISSLAAALIGRLQSLWATMFGGLAVGPRAVGAQPVRLALRLPLRCAVRARDRRAAVPLAAARRHDLAGDDLDGGDSRTRRQPRGGAHSAAARTANDRPRRRRARSARHRDRRPAGDRGRGLDHDLHERGDLFGRRSGLRHPLRPRRDDLARPDRAADGRLLGRHSALLCDLTPVPAAPARSRWDHLRDRDARRPAGACGSRVSISR